MQTNLDRLYKNSEKQEEDGIWFEIAEGTGFLIRRFGGYNSPKIKAALAKHFKPFSRQIEAGTLDAAKEKEIMAKVFVDACVTDWKGIEIDGKAASFSKELAVEFFVNLPELTDTLVAYASDSKNYREDLGNC